MNINEMNALFENCTCGKKHTCGVENVKIGKDVLTDIVDLCSAYKNILVVADDNTYRVCGEKICNSIKDVLEKAVILKPQGKVVVPNEESILIIEKALSEKTDLIVGVGSGVINDLCKYVSFNHNLNYFIVATAPSMDGYASVGAAMILNGMKVTVNARPPKAIIADIDVLKNAPLDMLQAGYGDIIGKYSCLNDWKLSTLVNDEYFCQKVYDLTHSCAQKVTMMAKGILERDGNTVGILMEALVTVGVLMSYVNSSRPASGSEHHMSHFFEITGILDNKDYFAHGIDVVYSSIYTQKMREELLKIDEPVMCDTITKEEYTSEINRIYHQLSNEVISLQNKMGWYEENKFGKYKKNWSEIKNILSEAPSLAEMKKCVSDIGLDVSEFEKLYGKAKIQDAIWFAKDLKDRYTVLWLYFDLKYNHCRGNGNLPF